MGESAEELRRDIEETRGGLTETLDAIGDRVSPGRVIERRKNRMVRGVQTVRDRIMGSASDARDTVADATGSAVDTMKDTPDIVRHQTQGSPVAAGAIAFGIGFLVAAILPPSQPEQRAAEGLMDKADPLKDELASVGRNVAEGVKGAAHDAIEEVKATTTESKQAVTDRVDDAITATKSTTEDAAASVKEQVTDSPS